MLQALNFPGFSLEAKISDVLGTPLPVKSFRLHQARNESADWSMVLDNSNGWFAPGATESDSPFAGKLECDPIQTDHTLRRWITVSMTVGGQTWKSPKLLQTEYQLDCETAGTTVTIGGSDATETLLGDDEHMADVDVRTSVRMAHEVLTEILQAYGHEQPTLDFLDYKIRLMHRVGSPMDWVRQILEIRQAWFTMEGSKFVARTGGWDGDRSADWVLTDRQHLKLLSYRRSLNGIINEASISRLEGAGSVAKEPTTGRGIGFVGPFELEFPCYTAIAAIEVEGGFPQLVVWYAADGTPLSTSGPSAIYAGGIPAKSFKFSILPDSPPTPTNPDRAYRFTIKGTSVNPAVLGSSFDDDFTKTYADFVDQGRSGVRRLNEAFTNELVPSGDVGLYMVTKMVQESLRRYAAARASVLLNPLVKLGDMVALNVSQAKLQSHLMLVDAREMNVDEKNALMTLELSRPRSE